MLIHSVVKQNAYFDSVTLMLFSSKLNGIDGVAEAAVMMGTDHNKDLMSNSGLLDQGKVKSITGNDLIIGIRAENQEALDHALFVLDEQFENKSSGKKDVGEKEYKTIDAVKNDKEESNFAVISVPGRFAYAEAKKALKNNIHVLLFSDNVSVEEEIELKDYAIEHDLLMMGPDCGTAIINGAALGFANVVSKGDIGLVAASGTGLQEVTVIIDRLGKGISQAIGTGGRDLKEAVGGRMMLHALDALAGDDQTRIIGLISKPPSESVMKRIIEKANGINKPVVACFLGADASVVEGSKILFAKNLEDIAYQLANYDETTKNTPEIATASDVSLSGKYLRGLFTGGTLAYEAMLLLQEKLGDIYSNIAVNKDLNLKDVLISKEHSIVDMGDDYFTDGMPHPMIDPRLRSARIIQEAEDADTAIILLDCVLGYGSHEDPASTIAEAIREAKLRATHDITFVASICGTDKDPQVFEKQKSTLQHAGVIVCETNAQAANLCASLLAEK